MVRPGDLGGALSSARRASPANAKTDVRSGGHRPRPVLCRSPPPGLLPSMRKLDGTGSAAIRDQHSRRRGATEADLPDRHPPRVMTKGKRSLAMAALESAAGSALVVEPIDREGHHFDPGRPDLCFSDHESRRVPRDRGLHQLAHKLRRTGLPAPSRTELPTRHRRNCSPGSATKVTSGILAVSRTGAGRVWRPRA